MTGWPQQTFTSYKSLPLKIIYRHVKQHRPQRTSLRYLSRLVHKPTVHSHSFFTTFKRVLIHESTFPFALWHLCFQNLCFEVLLRNLAECLLENHITAGLCGASGLNGNGMKAFRARQGVGTSCPVSLCRWLPAGRAVRSQTSSLQWQQKNILALVFKTINHNASYC